MNKSELLRRFLNVYWLRPENALWRALNAQAMSDLTFDEPSLDSSCGDGIFSFIRAGGDFKASFDVYSAVANLDQFNQNADIYDATNYEYHPLISEVPTYKMSVGIDWKDNLLTKAKELNFYRETFVHDNNLTLPFPDNSFQSIFSNSAYWIENLEFHLSELRRVLKRGGRAVLVVMNRATKDYTLEHFGELLSREWLDLIDRGRKDNYRGLRSSNEWDEVLTGAGFSVIDKRPQVQWVHSYVEYIGLRPISPLMIEMTNALSATDRERIKLKWIKAWGDLLVPFNDINFDLGIQRPAVECVYVLGKG